jgi:hypothetical protein
MPGSAKGVMFITLEDKKTEHIAEDGPTVFARARRLGAEGTVSKSVNPIDPDRAASGSKSAILPVSPCSGSAGRSSLHQSWQSGLPGLTFGMSVVTHWTRLLAGGCRKIVGREK